MPDLDILIPSSRKEADGYSFLPFLNPLEEEELWPAVDPELPLVERIKLERSELVFLIDGHDVRTEERDAETGAWRSRDPEKLGVNVYRQTPAQAEERKPISRRPLYPLRKIDRGECSIPGLRKSGLDSREVELLAAINNLQTAFKTSRDAKEAIVRVIVASHGTLDVDEPAARWKEIVRRLGDRLLSERVVSSGLAPERVNVSLFEKEEEKQLDIASIEKWVEGLRGWSDYPQILLTGYIQEIVSPGRLISWVTATQKPTPSYGLFFPTLKQAIAAAVIVDGDLRACLNCGRIFPAGRKDKVGHNARCASAIRQKRPPGPGRKTRIGG